MDDKQIKMFASSILVSDVISYIDNHKKEYKKFLKKELENQIKIKQRKGEKNEIRKYQQR